MIKKIAYKELKEILREGRMHVAFVIICLLFLLALFGAYQHYAALKQQHDEATLSMRNQWENQKDKNPHTAAHYGTFVFKPIYLLSYFDRGVDAYTGNTLFLEAHRSNQSKFKGIEDQADFARLGTLTPAFVMGVLIPLLIIIMGFDAAAGERENGNLRLLMSQGVKLSSLFWGKSLAIWIVVLLMALPFFVAGSIGLMLFNATADDWIRYSILILVYLIYFGCFINITLLISAWLGKRNTALVGSLFLWVFTCLIVPKVTVNLSRKIHAAPSWQTYNNTISDDLKNGVDGHDATSEFTEKLQEETLKKYGVDSVQDLPFNWDGFRMQKGEEHETFVYQKHKSKLLGVYKDQNRILNRASILSPFLLTSGLSQKLSGTDVEVYFDFLAAAEKYRIELVGELNGELTENFEYGDWNGTRGKDFFSKNIDFDYQSPKLASFSDKLKISILGLALWFTISGLAALFLFNKLKPL